MCKSVHKSMRTATTVVAAADSDGGCCCGSEAACCRWIHATTSPRPTTTKASELTVAARAQLNLSAESGKSKE